MLTRVLSRFCGTKDVREMTTEACNGFNILPQQKCYNLNYSEWPLLFDEGRTKEIVARLNDSIVIHFWNSLSKKFRFPSNATNAYTELAGKLCPKVMQKTGEIIT